MESRPALEADFEVPFTDLTSMNQEVARDLDASWRRVVSAGAFIGGSHVDRFEELWADYCGRRWAVGVANGTDALELTLRALGIGPGDEVLLPANTFVATAEAIVLAGATPRFVDVDPQTLLMAPAIVEAAVTPRCAAMIVVHLYGHVPDIDGLSQVASKAGLALVEDAAQAHGATWKGKRAGSFGHAGCFSFYPSKNLGAFGDAGAVVTNDAELARRVRSLGDHGRSSASRDRHELVGTNSRLDALQAAVLSAKLPLLDKWVEARRSAVDAYNRLLDGSGVRLVKAEQPGASACHLNVVRIPARNAVRAALEARRIRTGVHYPVPCHLHDPYRAFYREPLPVSERSASEVLSLPLFPHITTDQIRYVCRSLRQILEDEVLSRVR